MEVFGSMTRSRHCLSRIPFHDLPHRLIPIANALVVMLHIVSGIFYPMRYSKFYPDSFDPDVWWGGGWIVTYLILVYAMLLTYSQQEL
jgi:hypothetical protein